MANTSNLKGALREVVNSSKSKPSIDSKTASNATISEGQSAPDCAKADSCKENDTSPACAPQEVSLDDRDLPNVSGLQLDTKFLSAAPRSQDRSVVQLPVRKSAEEQSGVAEKAHENGNPISTLPNIATPPQSHLSASGGPSSAAVSATSTRSQSVASGYGSRSPALSAKASSFIPSTPITSTEYQSLPAPSLAVQFEMRETPDKGIGLFAIRDIPAGTRIICEAPLLEIPENQLHSTWNCYRKLSAQAKVVYDNLCDFAPSNLNFDQAVCIPDDCEDKAGLWSVQVKAMKIFSVNSFRLYNGCLGVFALASRLNHSCVPNVHFHSNTQLRKSTVHAARDIEAGEELLGNYIGAQVAYKTRAQRMEHLYINYGFICRCSACSDTTGVCDGRREALTFITWGLNEFKNDNAAEYDGHPFFPTSARAALAQAEDAVNILKAERLFTVELSTAYHFASDFALECKEWEKAVKYAFSQHDIETLLLGSEVEDRMQLGVSGLQWIKEVHTYLQTTPGKNKLSKSFWKGYAHHKSLWQQLMNDPVVERQAEQSAKKPGKKFQPKGSKWIDSKDNKQKIELSGGASVNCAAGKSEGSAA